MWNPFAKRSRQTGYGPQPDPHATVREPDLEYLRQWAATRPLVQGYVEPQTLMNEMSVVLVDLTGDWTRRPIGGPTGARAVAETLGIDLYDVLETGYPEAMRHKIEMERIERERAKQRQRRQAWEARRREQG